MAAAPPLAPVCRTAELRAHRGAPRAAAADGARRARRRRGRARRWPASAAARSWCSRARATTAATRSSSRAGCGSGSYDVTVVFRGDAATPARRRRRRASRRFVAAGGTTVDAIPPDVARDADRRRPVRHRPHARARPPTTRRWSNGPTRRGTPILALDVPSGLDAETGRRASRRRFARRATATFIALKPGLLTGDGVDHCGDMSRALARPRRRSDARGARASPRLDVASPRAARRAARGARATCTRARSARSASSAARDGMVGAPILAGRAALQHGRRQGLDRASRPPSFRPSIGPAGADAARTRTACSTPAPTRSSAAPASAPSARRDRSSRARSRKPSRWCSTPMRSTSSRADASLAQARRAHARRRRSPRRIPPKRRACSA